MTRFERLEFDRHGAQVIVIERPVLSDGRTGDADGAGWVEVRRATPSILEVIHPKGELRGGRRTGHTIEVADAARQALDASADWVTRLGNTTGAVPPARVYRRPGLVPLGPLTPRSGRLGRAGVER